jgi:hypothetical protein
VAEHGMAPAIICPGRRSAIAADNAPSQERSDGVALAIATKTLMKCIASTFEVALDLYSTNTLSEEALRAACRSTLSLLGQAAVRA